MGSIMITGGATGIGLAAMRAFRQAGHNVLLADRNAEGAEAAAAEVLPGRAAAFVCDLADPTQPALAVAKAVALFGGLDTVLANAGVLTSVPLADWTVAMWDRDQAINLRAPFLLAQAAAPHLAKSANASIIVTSSTGALRGHAGVPGYNASKAGLLGLVRSLADELSPAGTRVNALLPGIIDTPFNAPFWESHADPAAAAAKIEANIPMRRQGTPDDVTGAILFLASEASRYITGTSLVVDGGYSAV
jgi:dihydroanticapsin dehydrogenase